MNAIVLVCPTIGSMLAAADRLLTPNDLWSLSGAVTAVVVITNGLQYAFRLSPRVIGLLVSILIALGGAIVSGDHTWQDYAVAVPNAFLIYTSAIGVASIASTATQQRGTQPSDSRTEEVAIHRTRFWRSWFA